MSANPANGDGVLRTAAMAVPGYNSSPVYQHWCSSVVPANTLRCSTVYCFRTSGILERLGQTQQHNTLLLIQQTPTARTSRFNPHPSSKPHYSGVLMDAADPVSYVATSSVLAALSVLSLQLRQDLTARLAHTRVSSKSHSTTLVSCSINKYNKL
jgi:hypothetical protein